MKKNKKLTFKNNSPFRSCMTKINNTLIGKAEDIDIDLSIETIIL